MGRVRVFEACVCPWGRNGHRGRAYDGKSAMRHIVLSLCVGFLLWLAWLAWC